VERQGVGLFGLVCQLDLEGVVAKLAKGRYDPAAPTWVKVKNWKYTQRAGREEIFEKRGEPQKPASRTK